MPKNTLSEKYMKNVHIFRGPTHGFKFLPQFAPDLNIYEALPEIDMKEVIKNSPDARVIMQSEPGLDKCKSALTQRFLDEKFHLNLPHLHQQHVQDLLFQSKK
jgi:hypothetical protein